MVKWEKATCHSDVGILFRTKSQRGLTTQPNTSIECLIYNFFLPETVINWLGCKSLHHQCINTWSGLWCNQNPHPGVNSRQLHEWIDRVAGDVQTPPTLPWEILGMRTYHNTHCTVFSIKSFTVLPRQFFCSVLHLQDSIHNFVFIIIEILITITLHSEYGVV